MSTVYKQEWNKYDGKLGLVNFVFIISDVYEEVFTQTNPITTGIFDIGNIKEDLDIDVGIQAIDELSFTINSERIKTTIDTNAQQFTLAGLETTTPRYIALFINPATTGEISAKLFDGQIDFNAKSNDVKWNDTQWGSAQNPDRNWDFTATSFGIAILNKVNLISVLMAIGNDTSWINLKVQKDSSAQPSYEQYDTILQIQNTVNLPVLLDKIFEVAISLLPTEFSGFTINLINSQSTFYFTPGKPTFINLAQKDQLEGFIPENENPTRLRVLGTTGGTGTQCIINWDMALVNNANKEYSFQRYETLTELLYGIAVFFGCYVKYETVAYNVINISFLARQEIGTNEVYLIDAESASLSIEYADSDKENIAYFAEPNSLLIEGNDVYRFEPRDAVLTPSAKKQAEKKEGERLLFSLAPGLYYNMGMRKVANAIWENNYNNDHDHYGIITAIYQKSITNNTYLRPSVEMSIKVDGIETAYETSAECINANLANDGKFYKQEYEIDIPYLTGFSVNSDGSNNIWSDLKTGYKIKVDSIYYSIIGIERSVSNLTTKIRLHKLTQYAFEQPSANLMTIELPELFTSMFLSNPGSFIGTSAESLDPGVAVFLGDDELWHYGYSESVNGGLIGGITLSCGGIGTEVILMSNGYIQTGGLIGFDNISFNISSNDGLFVRALKGSEPLITNISQTELTEKSGTEDFYIKIGYPIANDAVVLDFSEQWIFED